MSSSITICDQCNNSIPRGRCIYKAFDSTFCSEDCSLELYNLIKNKDPHFRSPSSWKLLTDLANNDVIHSSTLKKTISHSHICENHTIPVPTQNNKPDSPQSIITTNYSIDEHDEFTTSISMIKLLPYIMCGKSYIMSSKSYIMSGKSYIMSGKSYIQEKVYYICGY